MVLRQRTTPCWIFGCRPVKLYRIGSCRRKGAPLNHVEQNSFIAFAWHSNILKKNFSDLRGFACRYFYLLILGTVGRNKLHPLHLHILSLSHPHTHTCAHTRAHMHTYPPTWTHTRAHFTSPSLTEGALKGPIVKPFASMPTIFLHRVFKLELKSEILSNIIRKIRPWHDGRVAYRVVDSVTDILKTPVSIWTLMLSFIGTG